MNEPGSFARGDHSGERKPRGGGFHSLHIRLFNMAADDLGGRIGHAGGERCGELPEFRAAVQASERQDLCDEIKNPDSPEDVQSGKSFGKPAGQHDIRAAGHACHNGGQQDQYNYPEQEIPLVPFNGEGVRLKTLHKQAFLAKFILGLFYQIMCDCAWVYVL
jgi:hypothetical protein